MRPYTEEPSAEQFACSVLDWRRVERSTRRPYGKKRPLGIPIWAVHYPSSQSTFGIPWVFLLVDRSSRSTVIVLLYHKLTSMTSTSLLPLPPDWLAQPCDDLRGEGNPAWSQRGGTNTLQDASLAPVCDGPDVDI